MKTNLLHFCFILSLLTIVGCTPEYDQDYVDYILIPNNAQVALAGSSYCFQTQSNCYQEITDTRKYDDDFQEKLINGSTPGTQVLNFSWNKTDIRLANGWNNWKDELLHNESASATDKYYIHQDTEETIGEVVFIKKHYKIKESDCTSHPAYLHLILDSLGDFSGNYHSKAWQVSKITDLNGVDISQDPQWDCYLDNTYSFKKNASFGVNTGTKRCDTDDTLIGSGMAIFRSFEISTENLDFTNPGKVTLILKDIDTGSQVYELEIISSDFDTAIFRVADQNGAKVDLHLISS